MSGPHYDGVAAWYDREFATSELGVFGRRSVVALLGDGSGTLLDVGCGGGAHAVAFAELGWTVSGVDISEDQLRLARNRGVNAVQARAEELPFTDATFDAVVSMWTHTDVEDFPAMLREIARVLRPSAPFVYIGAHPASSAPTRDSSRRRARRSLHPGYRETARYTDAPGISPHGLRAKVGARHLPLGLFIQSFLEAGLAIEQFSEEPDDREFPYVVLLRCQR